jgi:hypothetical protein
MESNHRLERCKLPPEPLSYTAEICNARRRQPIPSDRSTPSVSGARLAGRSFLVEPNLEHLKGAW